MLSAFPIGWTIYKAFFVCGASTVGLIWLAVAIRYGKQTGTASINIATFLLQNRRKHRC